MAAFLDPEPYWTGPMGNPMPDGDPGSWVVADFDAPCSRGCQGIVAGETVREDGTGEWECRICVLTDEAFAESKLEDVPEWARPDRTDEWRT